MSAPAPTHSDTTGSPGATQRVVGGVLVDVVVLGLISLGAAAV